MEYPLMYNPHLEQLEVGPTESQRKAALISDISLIQNCLNKGLVGVNQFDELYDLPLSQLIVMVNDQAELLRRIKASSQPLDYE